MNANKHLLSLALLAALGLAQVAHAQDYDDRWYVTGGIGYNQQDTDRRTKDTLALSLGVGRFLTRDWSLDAELNWQNADFDVRKYPGAPSGMDWLQYGISADLRRHLFVDNNKMWNPYLLFGIGYQRAKEDYPVNQTRSDGNLAAKIGVGMQRKLLGQGAALFIDDDEDIRAMQP